MAGREAAFEIDYMQRRVMGYNVHIPLTPDAVQHVLLDKAASYEKPDIVKSLLGPVIGRGLLTSDGPLWRDQRRIVVGQLRARRGRCANPDLRRCGAGDHGALAGGHARHGGAIDRGDHADHRRQPVRRRPAADQRRRVGAYHRRARGVRRAADPGAAAASGVRADADRAGRGCGGQNYLRADPGRGGRRPLRDGRQGDDFLGKLVAALRAKFDRAEAEALAIDNAATFYLAGHETTANAMTWALFLLSEQPELQARIAEEARAALAVGDRDPALPDRLPLLRQALDETLRLYPSAPRLDRQAIAHDEIDGHKVAPGDIVSIWPWIIHRHKKLWDDPDAFDIDRFAPGRKEERHRFQYLPFGGGARVCVGARFATYEALTILAHWLPNGASRPSPAGSCALGHGHLAARQRPAA